MFLLTKLSKTSFSQISLKIWIWEDDYYGALAYADDIVLLCPSIKGLQSMLDISKKFFNDIGLIKVLITQIPQNQKQSVLPLVLKLTHRPPPILLNDSFIPWVSKFIGSHII